MLIEFFISQRRIFQSLLKLPSIVFLQFQCIFLRSDHQMMLDFGAYGSAQDRASRQAIIESLRLVDVDVYANILLNALPPLEHLMIDISQSTEPEATWRVIRQTQDGLPKLEKMDKDERREMLKACPIKTQVVTCAATPAFSYHS